MRHAIAIAVLVLSAVLLILGIGQRTFLAGPSEISFQVDTQSETPFAVIDGAEFAKLPGQANVVVSGKDAFVATGMSRDVAGWVEPFPHAELSVDERERRLLSALIPAGTDEEGERSDEVPEEGLDPRGSDLWLESRMIEGAGTGTEQGTLRVPVSLAPDQSVIVATTGTDPLPSDLSLVWVQDRDTPWAGPLLASGAVLAVVGAVLYLLAVDYDRRGLGPRRGRKGPLQGIRNTFRGVGNGRGSREPAADARASSERATEGES